MPHQIVISYERHPYFIFNLVREILDEVPLLPQNEDERKKLFKEVLGEIILIRDFADEIYTDESRTKQLIVNSASLVLYLISEREHMLSEIVQNETCFEIDFKAGESDRTPGLPKFQFRVDERQTREQLVARSTTRFPWVQDHRSKRH